MSGEDIRDKLNQAMGTDLFKSLGRGEAVQSGLSSGSIRLNMALSGSPFIGYQWGRIAEVYGEESVGKSTLALYAILEAHKLDDQVGDPIPTAYIDAEHVMDSTYADRIGIDLDRLHLAQPDYGEQAMEAAEKAIELGYKVIVVDSVAALTPKVEIEGDMGDPHMGVQARLMSQGLRKLQSKVQKARAIIVFINQTRMKLGVQFGSPITTPGGMALKFYSSYRLELRSPRAGVKTRKTLAGSKGKDSQEEYGKTVNVKVVKNKVYPPYRRTDFFIEYGVGIDTVRDVVDFMEDLRAFENGKRLKLGERDYSKQGLMTALKRGNSELESAVSKWVGSMGG